MSAVLILLVTMGNSTARDKSRIQAEGESESGATIEAPPSADVGITRDVSFLHLASVKISGTHWKMH